jgi:hypothetical protein
MLPGFGFITSTLRDPDPLGMLTVACNAVEERIVVVTFVPPT